MSNFRSRVVDEHSELRARIIKLYGFIRGDKFTDLEVSDQHLLEQQLGVMKQYEKILRKRLERFEL